MFGWVTVTHFIVIALLAVGAVAIIWWGRRLHQRWKAAREEAMRAAQEREAED